MTSFARYNFCDYRHVCLSQVARCSYQVIADCVVYHAHLHVSTSHAAGRTYSGLPSDGRCHSGEADLWSQNFYLNHLCFHIVGCLARHSSESARVSADYTVCFGSHFGATGEHLHTTSTQMLCNYLPVNCFHRRICARRCCSGASESGSVLSGHYYYGLGLALHQSCIYSHLL